MDLRRFLVVGCLVGLAASKMSGCTLSPQPDLPIDSGSLPGAGGGANSSGGSSSSGGGWAGDDGPGPALGGGGNTSTLGTAGEGGQGGSTNPGESSDAGDGQTELPEFPDPGGEDDLEEPGYGGGNGDFGAPDDAPRGPAEKRGRGSLP